MKALSTKYFSESLTTQSSLLAFLISILFADSLYLFHDYSDGELLKFTLKTHLLSSYFNLL